MTIKAKSKAMPVRLSEVGGAEEEAVVEGEVEVVAEAGEGLARQHRQTHGKD